MSRDKKEKGKDKPRGYEVGYGRPPKHTQFRKGVSGNPKGRPKDIRNVRTVLREALRRKILVRQGDKIVTMNRQEAIVELLIARILAGDLRAIREMVPRIWDLGSEDDMVSDSDQALNRDDVAVVGNFRERIIRDALDEVENEQQSANVEGDAGTEEDR